MAQYKIGTATFTNGSATVSGSGTAWLSNLSAGDVIVRKGTTTDTYQAYQIGGVSSDTSLTLTAPYGGSTASSVEYVGHVGFAGANKPIFDNGDIETAAILNWWVVSIAQLADLGTAANLDAQTSAGDSTANRLLKTGALLSALGSDVFGKANILGTVSQSGGVPTGAIMEHDINASGEYWKYADGKLICACTPASSGYFTGSGRSVLGYAETGYQNYDGGFPAAFIAAPKVSSIYYANGLFSNIHGQEFLRSVSTTNYTIQRWSVGELLGVELVIAVGRWY